MIPYPSGTRSPWLSRRGRGEADVSLSLPPLCGARVWQYRLEGVGESSVSGAPRYATKSISPWKTQNPPFSFVLPCALLAYQPAETKSGGRHGIYPEESIAFLIQHPLPHLYPPFNTIPAPAQW